ADRGVVLDQRAAADDDVVADRAALAHAGLVAHDHALADRRPGEDDRAGRDDRPGAEYERRQVLALGGRARRERRLLADDGVVQDLAALADDRPRVDDRGLGDLSHARLSCMKSAITAGVALSRWGGDERGLELLERLNDRQAVARRLAAVAVA